MRNRILRLWLAFERFTPWLTAGVLLCLATDAFARAGGGHTYGSSHRRSSGGGWGHSSSGWHGGGGGGGHGGHDGDADLIYFIFRLLFEYPQIGVPVLVGVVLFFVWQANQQAPQEWHSDSTFRGRDRSDDGPSSIDQRGEAEAALAAYGRKVSLERLKKDDPNFSRPLFMDFLGLLYTRGAVARASGTVDSIAPYLTPAVAEEWSRRRQTGTVEEVVVGAIYLEDIQESGRETVCTMEVQASMMEVEGAERRPVWVSERWTVRREKGVLSKGPEDLRKLACPSCGAPCQLRPDGTCTYCDQVVNTGKFQWQVSAAVRLEHRAKPLESEMMGDGEEVGVHVPTLKQRDFGAAERAFLGRHPGFTKEGFLTRARTIFMSIQEAWTAGNLDQLRPFETDNLFSTHRYWLEMYKAAGLRNMLENTSIDRCMVVRYELDAYYEAITVRFYAGMLDYTVDAKGNLRGGSRSQVRRFSEYWTFIAAVGADVNRPVTERSCPSCGAPLKLAQTGVCQSCDAVISSGQFGWVLSRIDQAEAYSG